MSMNFNEKKQLLESLEYIDDAMLSDTLSRVNTDAAVAGRAPLTKRKSMYWLKQTAALVACTLLLSAIIPILSYVLSTNGTLGWSFPLASSGEGATEPEMENSVLEQTEPEETDLYPGELGSDGLRYMINEDGESASFIGWGDFKGNTAYIASVYEGLPVTKIVFYELWEQQKRLKEIYQTNPDYIEQTIAPDDFSFPNIKHVVIPDSVEYVEAGVINQCDYIETLHIGAGVNEILGEIFFNGKRGQNFSKITVSPENQYYTVKGNCLISIEGKVLIVGFADSVIPDDGSVEVIGACAFYNKLGLTSVVIPDGIVSIESGAFASNDELRSVSFPASINRLFCPFFGNGALTELTFAGTVEQWKYFVNKNTVWIRDSALTQVTCSDGVVELKYNHFGTLVE